SPIAPHSISRLEFSYSPRTGGHLYSCCGTDSASWTFPQAVAAAGCGNHALVRPHALMSGCTTCRHPAATDRSFRHAMSLNQVPSRGMHFASRTNPQMLSGRNQTLLYDLRGSTACLQSPNNELGERRNDR